MPEFVIIRLGKDSVADIELLDSFHDSPAQPILLSVSCTQVFSDLEPGCYCFLYLGSDNSKGVATPWTKGLRALGKVVGKQGGPNYADRKQVDLEVKIVFPESVAKKDLLARAPEDYYWISEVPVIGLDSYSNQTIQLIKHVESTQNPRALFCAIAAVHPSFKTQVENSYPELSNLFNYNPPQKDFEGDVAPPLSSGWRDYPLDSVFVRKEQRTVSEVVKRIEKNRIILNPDFQRDFVWSVKKQSRLIESCLMRIPLPVFYVAEAKDGRIIVVDGLQRLTTFKYYLDNKFALSKLGDGKEDTAQENPYIGKRFKDLSTTLRERLEDTQLTLYILDAKAPDRAKLDIFERVNSGEPLARQQMRNCLFSGPATTWLKNAASNENFLEATGRSIDTKSMRDREIINRFCAFQLLGVEQYKSDMDDFLARALEKMNSLGEQALNDLFELFVHSMKVNTLLFGRHAFRKSLVDGTNNKWADRTILNISLFDVCSVLLAQLEEHIVVEHSKELSAKIAGLLKNYDFFQAISYGTNGLIQIRARFRIMEEAIAEVLG
ncbi:DUF262 domain-containing protein [uncultured Desulfuromusa sp.]|uniref:DUF262 domain-containing protein n=1 Tax=uncultured Desulfuromusa sp. TaxID=219183 RepID=UPI002AA6DD9D|nr:DUF262 domain-containing protein [uncultured Desulfuromusa sp.]